MTESLLLRAGGRFRLRLALTALLIAAPAVLPAVTAPVEAPTSPKASAKTGFLVTGVVLTPEGEPVAGATVTLHPTATDYETARLALDGESRLPAVLQALSGKDGDFALTAPDAGPWTVRVRSAGHATAEQLLPPLVEDVHLASTRLLRASALRVQVLDPRGRPADQAVVVAARAGNLTAEGFWRPAPDFARTNPQGRARLVVPEGGEVAVRAWRQDLGLARQNDVQKGAAGLELRLPGGPPRGLTLLRPGGSEGVRRPAVDALVLTDDSLWGAFPADPEGRVTVPGLAPGARVRVLTADLHHAQAVLAPQPAEDSAPPEPWSLELAPPWILTGQVTDAASRRPLADAAVWLPIRAATAARTDRTGSFRLALAFPPAEGTSLHLAAVASGYLERSLRWNATSVGSASAALPTLALDKAAAIRGQVLEVLADGQRRPVAGAEISLLSPAQGRGGFRPSRPLLLRSDAGGRFTSSQVAPETLHRLQVVAGGYAPSETEVFTGRAGKLLEVPPILLERGRRAHGLVLDQEERPVAGAAIRLEPSVAERRFHTGGLLSPTGDPAAETASGQDGAFELLHLTAGIYDLVVHAPGFAPARVRGLEIREDEPETPLGTVLLQPGQVLEGQVTDRGGNPLANAEVRLTRRPEQLLWQTYGTDTVRSAEDGRFAIRDLPHGSALDLAVERRGFQPRELSGIEVPLDEPLIIPLEPAVQVTGRVLTPGGEPAVGAIVMLSPAQGGVRPVSQRFRPLWGRADDDGWFFVDGAAPGSYEVAASSDGYLPSEPREIELQEGEEADELVLRLRTGATLTGQVRGPDGKALEGARITPVTQGSVERILRAGKAPAVTDAEGRYRLDGLETGAATFEAIHSGYSRLARDLDVRPGENRLDFTFEGGTAVAGRVTDPAGAAIAGASVRLIRDGGGWYHSQHTFSEEDGGFRFDTVAPGRYRLEGGKEGYATSSGEEPIEVGSTPLTGLRLRLDTGGRIHGRVLGLDFDQLAQLRISAHGSAQGAEAVVDYEGRYSLEHLAPGRWTVIAEVASGGRRTAKSVVLEAGQSELELDLDFAGGLTLTGQVLVAGRPVDGIRLFLFGSSEGFYAQATSNLDGRFRLEGVPEGQYQLSAHDIRSGLRHQQFVDMTSDQDILVEIGTGEVSGIVRDAATGEPIAGAAVAAQPELQDVPGGGWTAGAVTDHQGRFRLVHLSEGAWQLLAEAPGYAPGRLVLTVSAGDEIADVELAIEPTEGLDLLVLEPTGRPPDTVALSLLSPEGLTIASERLRTGEGGRVRLATAPTGRWLLVVTTPHPSTLTLEVDVPAPLRQVQMPSTGTLAVRVPALGEGSGLLRLVDESGRPLRQTYGTALVQETYPLIQGATRLPFVPAGSWQLMATAGDGSTFQAAATVVPGSVVEVVLE